MFSCINPLNALLCGAGVVLVLVLVLVAGLALGLELWVYWSGRF